MTAAMAGRSGPDLFSLFSEEGRDSYRVRREPFVFSLLGQGLILVLLCLVAINPFPTPPGAPGMVRFKDFPLIFSGRSGGGGGGRDPLPASHGVPPQASLSPQIVPPTVKFPAEMPKLPMPETVEVAPDVPLPQGSQIGDPMSQFTRVPSNGPGGPGGIGPGCCDGVGPSMGPGVGDGPPGIYSPGKMGVTVPVAIYHPEPSFSDEARKAKQQGVVILLVVVGKDGRTYDIRVTQSLGMGLDEKAIEAVSQWRFKPATLNGQPVATQIAVELDFHLY